MLSSSVVNSAKWFTPMDAGCSSHLNRFQAKFQEFSGQLRSHIAWDIYRSNSSYHFPIDLCTKLKSVWFKINRKMVITIRIWFDLTWFRTDFSVWTNLLGIGGFNAFCNENNFWMIKKYVGQSACNIYIEYFVVYIQLYYQSFDN